MFHAAAPRGIAAGWAPVSMAPQSAKPRGGQVDRAADGRADSGGDAPAPSERLVIARLGAPYGVLGWMRIQPFTEEAEAVLGYRPWWLTRPTLSPGHERPPLAVHVEEFRAQRAGCLVKLRGIDDRDQAALWRNAEILGDRAQRPPLGAGEYYWDQLVGLAVLTEDGVSLGRVSSLLETGANDVLVVVGERERLIPFLPDAVIVSVDLAGGELIVAWDPDF